MRLLLSMNRNEPLEWESAAKGHFVGGMLMM